MKSKLQKLEALIQELIEVRMVSLLPGQKLERDVLQRLASAIQASVSNKSETGAAPNIFTLIVHPNALSRWQDAQLLNALNETLKAVGREAGLEFAAPPTLSVASDAALGESEARVIVSHKVESLGPTEVVAQIEAPQAEDNSLPQNAFLIIDGRKVFPLSVPVVNIGRRLENQMVVDDPRVSRNHAQLRAIKGRFVLFDLNSTGGTYVNGQRTSQSILYPGDVISLAGFTLVFGQDNPPPRLDLRETGPLDKKSTERATAILKTYPDSRIKKK
ncbi:MAG: DUF3662 domain-containing protein [Chloroflexi bacterium]|nr:DUF3662 domain-containing protein [Chloroflexota bacterium]